MDTSTIVALGTGLAFILLFVPLAIIASKVRSKQYNELQALYRQVLEQNRKSLEAQAESTAVMRELIEALRAQK